MIAFNRCVQAGVLVFLAMVAFPLEAQVDAVLADIAERYYAAAGGRSVWRGIVSLVAQGESLERSPFKRSDRVSFRYGARGLQFVQRVPPSFVTGPLVFTASPPTTWHKGVRELGTPYGATIRDTMTRQESAQVIRKLAEWIAGVAPALVLEPRTGSVLRARGIAAGSVELSDHIGAFGTLSFDSATHLPASLLVRGRGVRGPAETVVVYGDFRTVGGVLVPFRITTRGGSRTVLLQQYSLNPSLPESLFVNPPTTIELEQIVAFEAPKSGDPNTRRPTR